MNYREEVEALGFRVFDCHSIDGERVEGFIARLVGSACEYKVRLELGESEIEGLSRLLALVQEALV